MTDQGFWMLIDDASRARDPYIALRSALCALGREEIAAFHNIFLAKLAEAYTFPLLEANFVISSYVSDELFLDFRAWLVSTGSAKYRSALANPESISDWLDKAAVDDLTGDWMLVVAEDAFIESGGTEEEFFHAICETPDPEIVTDWPASKEDYRRKYPKLVEKFWNQERIRLMHSDAHAG